MHNRRKERLKMDIRSISGMKNKTIYVYKTGKIYVNNNVQ